MFVLFSLNILDSFFVYKILMMAMAMHFIAPIIGHRMFFISLLLRIEIVLPNKNKDLKFLKLIKFYHFGNCLSIKFSNPFVACTNKDMVLYEGGIHHQIYGVACGLYLSDMHSQT